MAVAIGNATVRAMLRMHRPRTLVAPMLHAGLRFVVCTDTGRPRALGLRSSGRLRSGRGAVGGNAALGGCHRRARDAMRALAR